MLETLRQHLLDLVVLEDAVRGGGSGIYILSNQTRPDD